MKRLTILKLEDGEEISEKLKDEMQAFSDRVDTRSLYDFDATDGQTGNVTVVILSSLVCQEIHLIPDGVWTKLLEYTDTTLFLICCRADGESNFRKLCQQINVAESKLQLFNVKRDPTEWFQAESRVKIMLSELDQRKSLLIPMERAFTVKPNVIHQSTREVTVVLFEEFPIARSLRAEIVSGIGDKTTDRTVKKIRNGVWAMDTTDVSLGEHTVRIVMDDEDIGGVTLTVQGDMDVIVQPLSRIMATDTRRFLSRLLQIEEDSFDLELSTILSEKSSAMLVRLYRGVLELASPDIKGIGSESILHFFAKYGCTKSMKAIKQSVVNWRELCCRQNEDGDTPLEVAQKQNQAAIEKLLTSDSDEEVFERTTSPITSSVKETYEPRQKTLSFRGTDNENKETFARRQKQLSAGSTDNEIKAQRSRRVNSYDSGFSTGSEGRSDARSTSSQRRLASDSDMTVSKAVAEKEIGEFWKKKSFSFHTTRERNHHYDEIPNVEQPFMRPRAVTPLYDKPWEENQLPTGVMPQKPTDEGEPQITQL